MGAIDQQANEGAMKPGIPNTKQRPRGRNMGGGKKPQRIATYDSSGPEIRVRGNAHQVLEKYLAMARDASSQGDRIAAENYFQHAEHYFRVINSSNQGNGRPRHTPSPAEEPAGGEDEGEGEEEQSAAEDQTDGHTALNA